MVKKDNALNILGNFVNTKLNTLGDNNPIFNIFVRPYIERVISNNMSKVDNLLSLIADENGMVDIDGILNDMIDRLIVSEVNKINGINIGKGEIKIDVPLINKSIVFTTDDFKELHNNIKKYGMLEKADGRI